MGTTSRTWEALLRKVVEANKDLVSDKRLKGHLDRLAERFPALRNVVVGEGGVSLPEDFPEDESGLVAVATILGALYLVLDMFTGPSAAAERVRRPVREYINGSLPPGTVLGLNRFLPKLHLEREAGEEQAEEGRPGEGAAGAAPAVAGEATVEARGEMPGEELAAQFPGTVPWLGEDIPMGASLLVEGPGEAKERWCLRFIGEGLSAGESALVLLAQSVEDFRRKMTAEGCDTGPAEKEGRLKILDWHTFRERNVGDLEDDGSVLRLPMELPWVGSGMNIALQELPESPAPRAYVDILPRALATVAIETVFNFVQVTMLKFKKKRMTGLFLSEEEKDPEKAAIRLSFHSTVEIAALGADRISVRTAGPLVRWTLKKMAVRDGHLVVEEEELLKRAEPPAEAPHLAELKAKLEQWRSRGYDVSSLVTVLKADPASARKAFDDFASGVEKMRNIRDDLRILDLSGFEAEQAAIKEMMGDLANLPRIEEAMAGLRAKLDRRRVEERRAHGAPPVAVEVAGPPEKGPPVAVPAEEEAIFEMVTEEEEAQPPIARPAGTEVPTAAEARPAALPGGAPEGAIPVASPAPPPEDEAARRLEREIASRAQEEKRREFKEALEKWRQEGYNVAPLEGSIGLELEQVRRDFLLFRVQLQRLRELGDELAAVDSPSVSDRKATLIPLLKDVSRTAELERAVAELREEAERHRERDRGRREEEQRRRAKLNERIFWWSSHGLKVDRLEAALGRDLAGAEAELADFEKKARLLMDLREELAGLDLEGVGRAAAALEEKLHDVDDLPSAESDLRMLKEEKLRLSGEGREKQRLRTAMEEWRSKGFDVSHLERALDLPPERQRAEFDRFSSGVEVLSRVASQLASLPPGGREGDLAALKAMLSEPARAEEARRLLSRIRHDIERARAEEGERAEHRSQVDQWKRSGLPVTGLEEALGKDLVSLRRAMLDFRFRASLLEGLRDLLEPLKEGPLASEASALSGELRDISKLAENEKRVLELRERADAMLLSSGKDLQGECEMDRKLLGKLEGWMDGGHLVRKLETSLRADRGTFRAEAERHEQDMEQLAKLSSAIEVLDTKGHERDLEYLRAMLRDPEKLTAARALHDALKADIARRKKEEERRSAFRSAIREWEQKGYDTADAAGALEGDLEGASRELVLFRAKVSVGENLRRQLDLLGALGFMDEVGELRGRLSDLGSLDGVQREVEQLWREAEAARRTSSGRLEEERARRRELRERMAAYVEQGVVVRRLDRALRLTTEEACAEFARFEQGLQRLRALEERLVQLSEPGFELELATLRSKVDDVDRLEELEKGTEELGARVEAARKEAARKRAEQSASEKEEALRRALEERLADWELKGHEMAPLREALRAPAAEASARFDEFERSLRWSLEMRGELEQLVKKDMAGVEGAPEVARLLEDPWRVKDAERALLDLRRRIDAATASRSPEMEELLEKVRELGSRGEDTSRLWDAAERGIPDLRRALDDHEKELRDRDLADTWKGIKSRLVSEKGADGRSADEGPAVPGAKAAKRKRKVKK